ncbi:type II and III secretion system protein family protein [Parvularcula oceani]|uniref:type II and III secretion system protein family protein n=1 Tax=Parvularcula oceani TaxID=1247963 RepID=UPI00068E916A|nr:type II and III secretion system protein family protein [Parvularcula oceani]
MNISTRTAARLTLGWGSAVAVATMGLLGAMSMVPAAAQEAVVDTGGEAATSRELILPLGKAAIVELPRGASDVLVSNPVVVDTVIRTPRRVYVMGKAPGQANAFFFDSRNQQILNLEIRVEQDADVIEDLIEKLLPASRITVETLGENIVLHGTADTPGEAQRAVEIAARFTGGDADSASVMNMISVREPGQVMLKVRVLEMQRQLTRQLGVDLDGVVALDDALIDFAVDTAGPTSGGLSAGGSSRNLGDLEALDYALDVFEQNNLVKTLAEPSLIALSGEEAQFFAGGEVAFPVAGGLGTTTIEFRPFGVELNFQPTVRSKGSINIVLATKVSDVNDALGSVVGGGFTQTPTGETVALGTSFVPGFVTRSATTTVDLPSGASFAIAGLLQENIQETVDGVPGLKETPVLGQLFRSQKFQNDETELVIIATPYLVEPTTLAELTDPGQGFAPPTLLQSVLLGQLESSFGMHDSGVGEASLQGPLGFILD